MIFCNESASSGDLNLLESLERIVEYRTLGLFCNEGPDTRSACLWYFQQQFILVTVLKMLSSTEILLLKPLNTRNDFGIPPGKISWQ